jgi:hypothetical protein
VAKRFAMSFDEIDTDKIVRFGHAADNGTNMTFEEALEHVYHGDSTKLYCTQKVINMENERDFRISNDIYLPEKCFRLQRSKYSLIAHTQYNCSDPNTILMKQLSVKLLDSNYLVRDSLLVRNASDYDFELTGILNPRTCKIFIVWLDDRKQKNAALYAIDELNAKFKKILSTQTAPRISDETVKDLEALGWQHNFNN